MPLEFYKLCKSKNEGWSLQSITNFSNFTGFNVTITPTSFAFLAVHKINLKAIVNTWSGASPFTQVQCSFFYKINGVTKMTEFYYPLNEFGFATTGYLIPMIVDKDFHDEGTLLTVNGTNNFNFVLTVGSATVGYVEGIMYFEGIYQ